MSIHDTFTGEVIQSQTFEGPPPKGCPATYQFRGTLRVAMIQGGNPEGAPILAWIEAVTAAQGALDPKLPGLK